MSQATASLHAAAELDDGVARKAIAAACLEVRRTAVFIELDAAHDAQAGNKAFHRLDVNRADDGRAGRCAHSAAGQLRLFLLALKRHNQ